MIRKLVVFMMILSTTSCAYAGKLISDLPNDTSGGTTDDMIETLDAPGGTPASKHVTLGALFGGPSSQGTIGWTKQGTILHPVLSSDNVGIGTWTASTALAVNGTITATSYAGDGSGLTGLPSSSQWTTSGSNIYYNTGNVAIGTSSPVSALDLNGNTATAGEYDLTGGGALNISAANGIGLDGNHASYTTPGLFMNTNGTVSIGGTGGAQNLNIYGGTTTLAAISIRNTGTPGSSAGAGFSMFGFQTGTASANGDRFGFETWGGATDTSGTTNNSTSIQSKAVGQWSGSSAGSNLEFQTTPQNVTPNGATSRVTAMLIDDNQNVGIGTSGPTTRFQVGSRFLVVNSAGNVGIGTSSPGAGAGLVVMNRNIGIGTVSPGESLDIARGGIRAVGIGTTVPNPLCRKADGTFGTYTGSTWTGTCN